MTTDSLTPAAPPADLEEEPTVLTNVLTEDLPLTVKVPQITLMDGEKIVRHPKDDSKVAWRVTRRSRDEDGRLVITYTAPDEETGEEQAGEFAFDDLDLWVMVEVGQVSR